MRADRSHGHDLQLSNHPEDHICAFDGESKEMEHILARECKEEEYNPAGNSKGKEYVLANKSKEKE